MIKNCEQEDRRRLSFPVILLNDVMKRRGFLSYDVNGKYEAPTH